MNVLDIKYALAKKGLTFVALDRKYGLSRGLTRVALTSPNPKGELAIATELGLHPKDIWPNRYDETGKRLKPQPKTEYLYTPEYLKGANNNA